MNRRRFLNGLMAGGLVAGLAASRRAGAADAPTASDFIAAMGHELSALLAGVTSAAQRRERLKPFLERVVAVDRVAQFCLGRYWRRATPAQQGRYKAVFLGALTTSVASRAGSYAGQTQITMLPEVAQSGGMAVPTVIRNGKAPPVHITWLIDTGAAPFRVLDVSAEGISLRQSLRSDYSAFLDRHGGDIDLFINALRQHVGG